MKTKIFYGNQYVTSFDCNGKKHTRLQILGQRIIRTTKKTLLAVTFVTIGLWILTAYLVSKSVPNVVMAETVIEKIAPSPVLERIMQCESNGRHLNKSGQVLVNVNTDGSYDTGKFQINSVWNKKATELGLDLTKETDNQKMAEWIYANRGTQDWYSSAKCWQR